jgi:putative ABC transport system permease protein
LAQTPRFSACLTISSYDRFRSMRGPCGRLSGRAQKGFIHLSQNPGWNIVPRTTHYGSLHNTSMNRLAQDIRYGCRMLRKSPGFTLVAIATLALSLGANTAIFTIVNAVFLKPPQYAEPDRIVRVLEAPPGGGRNGISTLDFLDWQKQNKVFDFMSAIVGDTVSLTGDGEPVQIPVYRVSAHHFDILEIRAALGRTFVDGEDQAGKDHVAVLGDTLWRTNFGGDPNIVGRKISLNGEAYTVIGVLPRNTPLERGGARGRIWLPLLFAPSNMTRNFYWFGAIARLKAGVTLEQARAQMDAIASRLAHDFPDSNKDMGVGVDRLADTIRGSNLTQSLYLLLAAVGMVLLIACANLANLSLMRVVGREHEIAIRIALGAGRRALLRQFLTESLLLSTAGGLLGLAIGQLALAGLKAVPQFALPGEADVRLDSRVLIVSFLLAMLTGLAIGLFPALQATRFHLTNSLKQGSVGSSTGVSHARVRSGLVIAEVALAFILLTGAGLLIRSLDKLSQVDPGFNTTNVLTFGLPVSDKNFPDPAALNSYLRQVSAQLRMLPGVIEVAMTSALPMQGWGYGMPFQIADQQTVDRRHHEACFFKMVSSSYFRTLEMHLRQGRLLADADLHGSPPVAVINETMEKKYFPGVNPIGKRILVQEIVPGKTQFGNDVAWEVVGVVADENVFGLDDSYESSGMYVTNEQSAVYSQSVLIRSTIDTALLREAVKRAVHEVNRDQVITNLKTLEVIKADSLGYDRVRAWLLGGFAGVSLLLAAIGIYGVLSYSVTQRTREIGIRLALGASRGNVLRLLLGHGMTLIGLGLLLGVGGALGLTQLLASLLFGVGGRDPVTMTAVAGILSLVAIVACLLAARRATQVDPIIALRAE